MLKQTKSNKQSENGYSVNVPVLTEKQLNNIQHILYRRNSFDLCFIKRIIEWCEKDGKRKISAAIFFKQLIKHNYFVIGRT